MQEYTAVLNRWSRWPVREGSYVYTGFISDDIKGRFADGEQITTSLVLEDKGGVVDDLVVTINSVYLLGEPEEEVGF